MTTPFRYPVDLIIRYNNTIEYRHSLRLIFSMSSSKFPVLDDDIDPVSRDELEYDEEAAKQARDYVFRTTKKNPIFNELYLLAAARMFSTDPEIGLSVLFSYDYLEIFHYCLVSFYDVSVLPDRNIPFDETNRGVVELKRRLQ